MKRTVSKVPAYKTSDVYALKALSEGKANEGQQKQALQWIIDSACAFRVDPFQEDSPRKTDFMLGKGSVARAILYLVQLPADAVSKLKGKE